MTKALDVDMRGKVAVVTGATGGIGKEIARGLARMGATVVLGARDAGRGAAARDEIAKETGNASVVVGAVDVASIASVEAFAAAVTREHGRVHVLVNNAGAWFTERRASADGIELTFATNVLGPYLLAKGLEGALRAAAPARVVNVVSAFASNYDASDLEFSRRGYDGFKAYGASKQALRMLTWGLAKRLEGSGVTANAAAPGFVRTNFNQNAKGFMATMLGFSAKLFAVTPAEGADTPLWAAVAPELAGVTGTYFDARKEKDGKFREPGPIADLEARCEAMLARRGGGARAA
ncbi:MAG TPA: SDR family NAD(P)-dependent oxidoreductase [Minicystis sp.]|nr:SDR family NAD(P)-dependent oxidoreductase [Minicystis sp.]